MIVKRFSPSLVAVLACAVGSVQADTSAPATSAKKSVGKIGQSIIEFVESAHRTIGFSGAVLAANEGKVVAATAVGTLDKKHTRLLETTSLFEIASCTKIFTALAILRLQEAGKLKLDDPINKHLPGIPDNCNNITIRHLLQHTSGIPGTNTLGSGDDLSAAIPTFLDGGPRHPPGTQWEYWNQGYALLSEIISRASGKSYQQFCRDEIFTPCRMTQSRFTGEKPPEKVTVATGFSSKGPSRSALQHPYGSYGFQYRGMGGLVTNLVDLWRWDRAMARGQLLNAALLNEMTTPGLGGYGLGWFIETGPDGKQVLRHGGSVRGFLAEIRRYPSVDGCLIVLSNQDVTLPMELVTAGCEAILFGKVPKIEFPAPIAKKQLAGIKGNYEDSRGRRLEITRELQLAPARILWGGPITRGYIGTDEKSAIRLFMFESFDPVEFRATSRLKIDSDKRGIVKSVSITDLHPELTFDRVK